MLHDIILAGQSENRIKEVKDALSAKFDTKDMGKLHHFLGMSVAQDDTGECVWIGQPTYTENLLKKFRMQDCKPAGTFSDVSTKLEKAADEEEKVDQQQYQSAVGSFMYLSVSTRPNIAFAVGNLARFSTKPTKSHWTALKHVFRYFRGTINLGILYARKSQKNALVSLMLIGLETSMTGNRRLVTCFKSVEELLPGRAGNKVVSHSLLLRQSMLHSPVQLKNQCGSSN